MPNALAGARAANFLARLVYAPIWRRAVRHATPPRQPPAHRPPAVLPPQPALVATPASATATMGVSNARPATPPSLLAPATRTVSTTPSVSALTLPRPRPAICRPRPAARPDTCAWRVGAPMCAATAPRAAPPTRVATQPTAIAALARNVQSGLRMQLARRPTSVRLEIAYRAQPAAVRAASAVEPVVPPMARPSAEPTINVRRAALRASILSAKTAALRSVWPRLLPP